MHTGPSRRWRGGKGLEYHREKKKDIDHEYHGGRRGDLEGIHARAEVEDAVGASMPMEIGNGPVSGS